MRNQQSAENIPEPSPVPTGEALLRLIFNHSDQSIILVDCNLKILEANDFAKRAAKNIRGIDMYPGMDIRHLTSIDEEEAKAAFEKVFNGETLLLERNFTINKITNWYSIEIRPVYVNGQVLGAVMNSKDITARKQAELDLQKSEERWRFALEGANQGVWDWDLVTNEVYYSSSYKRLYGFSDEDQLQTIFDWKSKIHPDDKDKVEQAIREHLQSEDPYHESRYRILNKQGEYIWIWARGMIMKKDESGKPIRMIGTHSDITQQVHAEITYRSLFQSNPLPCWIYVSDNGQFLEVNEAAIHQYGFTEKEFLQADLSLIHPDESRDKLKDRLKRDKQRTLSSYYNWLHRKKDGTLINVDLNLTSILYKGRDAKLVVALDVTQKVKVENELRRSNERFLYAAKASSEGLWEWDTATGHFYVSQAYTDIFGWKVNEERTFDEWHDYIHDADKAETISSYYNALEDPAVDHWKKEYRYRKSDGSYAHVIDKASILRDEQGKAIRVIGALQDITEQKRTEEELRKSNERYENVLIATSDIVWDWDVRNSMILWSDNYTRTFGWELPPDRTMSDDSCFPKFHQDDRAHVIQSLKDILFDPTRFFWHEEFRYLKKDGSYCYISDRGYVIRNEQGEAIRMIGAMQDITSQRKAEEHIRKTNDMFQLVNRATSDAIYDWDLQSNDLYWGEGIQNLFGFNPRQVTIEVWESLVHPADQERVNASLQEALNDPQVNTWKIEYRFARATGGYSYVLERGFVMRDEEGKAIRLIGSMQDISERHYGEQLLSLEKTIFELSTNPRLEFKNIILTLLKGIEDIHEDAYTSVLLLNEADDTLIPFTAPRIPEGFSKAIRGMRIGPDEGSCGTSMWNKSTVIVSDIGSDPSWVKYKELAAEFEFLSCWSLPIIHSSGHVMGSLAIYFKAKKSPTRTEINTFERVRSIIRVLMENNWSMQRIREAKERFDIMMRATHDLIWDWNLENNIFYRDELGLQKVYGIPNNDIIADFKDWLNRIHPEDQERVASVMNQILQSKDQNHFDVEYRFRRADNTYSHVFDRGILVRNGEGKPVRMIGAAQDVTERKRLEQELLQNELEKQKAINQATVDTQEAERSEIGKELHDNVNQVLTTTKLYLDLASSSPELKDELILKSSKNIINVINEIRQLSRSLMDPSIGDLGLTDSIHDLVENINLTRKLHVKLLTDKRIETLLSKNHKLTVFRIIQEALNNAIRHARATTVTIRFTIIKTEMEITIEDDGIGFDPLQIKKGAGLKNIQNRIYLIDGTQTILTAPGKGCKIIIRFPIIKQPIEHTQ